MMNGSSALRNLPFRCKLRFRREKKSLFNNAFDLINVVNHSRTFYKFHFHVDPSVGVRRESSRSYLCLINFHSGMKRMGD